MKKIVNWFVRKNSSSLCIVTSTSTWHAIGCCMVLCGFIVRTFRCAVCHVHILFYQHTYKYVCCRECRCETARARIRSTLCIEKTWHRRGGPYRIEYIDRTVDDEDEATAAMNYYAWQRCSLFLISSIYVSHIFLASAMIHDHFPSEINWNA